MSQVIMGMVSAGSVGISPAGYKLFFEPGLERTYSFKAFNSDPDMNTGIYVKGDLAEYVVLSEDSIKGSGVFQVTLKLPESIEKPGNHRLLIGVRENPSGMEGGIGGIAAIQAPIDIMVPYPGKYVEVDFRVSDINEGEKSLIELDVHNLGLDDIVFKPNIDVYFNGKLIVTKTLGYTTLVSKNSSYFRELLDSEDLVAGKYQVVMTFDYGNSIRVEKVLRVGKQDVNVTDYSNRFIKGKVNDFYIEVESLWNLPLEKVYSEVSVTSDGQLIKTLKLSFVDLEPWGRENLTGFFDATDLETGRYTGNLRIFHGDEVSSKLVYLYIDNPPIELKYYILGIIVIFLIVLVFYLGFRVRSLKNDKNGHEKRKKE